MLFVRQSLHELHVVHTLEEVTVKVMKQLCLEQPKQLILFWVVNVKGKVSSHQISQMAAHSVAGSFLHHLICQQKGVIVTVLVLNDDHARRTCCYLICHIVVFCLNKGTNVNN